MVNKIYTIGDFIEALDNAGLLMGTDISDAYAKTEVTELTFDSRKVTPGTLFIAKGVHFKEEYLFSSIEKGAVALFCEEELPLNVPQIIVEDTKRTMAKIAAAFYNEPSKAINLYGVTGTNGKTTVTHLLQRILEENKQKCALIGTLGYKLSSNDDYKDAKHTTPQPPELQRDLRLMADSDIQNVVMEVSSHSLEIGRAHV